MTSLLIIGAALLGCGSTVYVLGSGPTRTSLLHAPEKLIPPQTLRFVDARGTELATLEVWASDLNILRFGYWNLQLHSDGTSVLIFDSPGVRWNEAKNRIQRPTDETIDAVVQRSAHLYARAYPFADMLEFDIETPAGSRQFFDTPKPTNLSYVSRQLERDREWYQERFLRTTTAQAVVASEDLILKRRDGRPFANFGLNEAGQPVFGFLDERGRLWGAWVWRNGLLKPIWSDLALFNKSGRLWLSVEFHPDDAPALTYTSTDLKGVKGTTIFIFDADDGEPKEVFDLGSVGFGSIPWLEGPKDVPVLPIRLIDNRNREIWRAP